MERYHMTSSYRYRVVDVFTEHPLEGNPLAVFPDSGGLDSVAMQKIARELNLSETVFVVPASPAACLLGIRIFTPTQEMRFAGHPTIGAAFVMLEEGLVRRDTDRFVIEEAVGPVPVRVEGRDTRLIWLNTPPIQGGRLCDSALCARSLGLKRDDLCEIPPQLLNAGNPTLFIALKDRRSVDAAGLDFAGVMALRDLEPEPFCVFVFAPTSTGAYSRMFAPEYGIPEDPATGSSTGPLAAYMIKHGLISGADGTRFVSEQGTKMGRRSFLHALVNGEHGRYGIEVGGHVTPLVEAKMTLD
jgi:trans-2,3-dihydro-3-hydroxyanthranilate isomerase